MESVDVSILNTAIPAMAASLHVNPVDLKIALISYLLSLAVFIPVSGWIADKFGIKQTFITALGIFTLASLGCGYATSLTQLTLMRALQGIGGSLMAPIGRLIIARHFERHELVTVMGRVIMVSAMGIMLGPALGGYIVHYLAWPWIFWVNIPIGLFAIIISCFWLHRRKTHPHLHPLDKTGFLLFGSGLSGLILGFSAISESAFSLSLIIVILCASFCLLIVYRIHSRHQKYPIINTSLFAFRTFKISALGNLMVRIGFTGIPFLLPLLYQIGFGYPAQISGLLISPVALGVLLVKSFATRILQHFGFRKLLICNTLIISLILCSFMLIDAHTSLLTIATLNGLFGLAMTLQYTCMNSLAYADVSSEQLSATTSIMSTVQQFAQSLGVAFAAMLVHWFSGSHMERLTPSVFHHAFMVMAVFNAGCVFIFFRLQPNDGYQMYKSEQASS